ncbi:MAG: hypothetical protein IPM70_18705 [Proteobacteria bacterium]|nr:hypothetical protein [Pseudomonadota bacterium]
MCSGVDSKSGLIAEHPDSSGALGHGGPAARRRVFLRGAARCWRAWRRPGWLESRIARLRHRNVGFPIPSSTSATPRSAASAAWLAAAKFFCVPYGASTEGEGRFTAPVPPAAWAGIREVPKQALIAPQIQPKLAVPSAPGAAARRCRASAARRAAPQA